MTGWPIHEYAPRPEWRRLRRATLILREHVRREVQPIIEWQIRQVDRALAYLRNLVARP